jgi:tRNA(adenine34) deaminase
MPLREALSEVSMKKWSLSSTSDRARRNRLSFPSVPKFGILCVLGGPIAGNRGDLKGVRQAGIAGEGWADDAHMRLALREAARAARAGEVPVGAVLVGAAGEVIARGHNRPILGSDPTAHAEVVTLRRAARKLGNYRLPGTTLYVTVEPCPMCAGALVLARVARVVFGAADPKGGAVRTLYRILEDPRLNHQIEVAGGVLEKECSTLLRDFFRDRRP